MNLKLILLASVQSDSIQLPDDQEPDPKRLQSCNMLLSTLSAVKALSRSHLTGSVQQLPSCSPLERTLLI